MPPDAPQAAEQTLAIRDIHLPDPVSWWPPAPGWWLLLAVVVLLVILGLSMWKHKLDRLQSVKHLAEQELQSLERAYLQDQDSVQLLKDLSVFLRRTSMSASSRDECASLTGDDWLKFLDNCSSHKGFDSDLGRQLLVAPYARTDDKSLSKAMETLSHCKSWVRGLS